MHAHPRHPAALASLRHLGCIISSSPFASRAVLRFFKTPPEATNTGPGINREPGGGARGCDFEERVGAYARTEEGCFLQPSLSVQVESKMPYCTLNIELCIQHDNRAGLSS